MHLDSMPRTFALGRTHLDPLNAQQWRTIAGCILRVLADSNQTRDIMVAEEIAAQAQLRYLLAEGILDSDQGRALLRDRPSFADLDMDALAKLPAHTLGGALARFLERNGLSGQVYQEPVTHFEDPDMVLLLQRLRHTHDVWHVLMDFTPEGHEEILLHAFSLAQTGMPSSVALLLLGSIKHMLLEARFHCLLFSLREAFQRGQRAQPLLDVYWERHWDMPLQAVRRQLAIEPWTAADRRATRRWALSA